MFAKFHAGDFSLDDAPWLGRPVEVDSNHIKALTENNQPYTMLETANILNISKSTAIGENENCLIFYGRNETDFLDNPITQNKTPTS